jgi:exopolyphosphatase/guanosine-5'-triphosphate,3'-diphosphate pyrophosphatase
VHLHELALSQVNELEARLAVRNVEERANIAGLQPQRAPVILGGVVAIAELMRATGFDRLTVSESDLLFGLSITTDAAASGASSPVGWTPEIR